jgi:hypothetical protein
MQGIAENLGAIDSEGFGPTLYLGGVVVGNSKAQHRHTQKQNAYDGD